MISIIIPSFGRASLCGLVSSIQSGATSAGLRYETDYEIVVALDVRAQLPTQVSIGSVRVVRASDIGVNRARNEGALQSRGQLLWFLDDDTELMGSESFAAIHEIFQDPLIDAAGGDYVSADDSDWSERGYNSFCSIWRATAGEHELEQLLGGTLVVRKSAWELASGFDEHIEYGGAETAFVQRLKKNAYRAKPSRKVVFRTELSVRHRPGARGLKAWMTLAYRQGARRADTASELPEMQHRFQRACKFLRAQDVKTLASLVSFSAPYLVSSRIGRIRRR